eukprot:TRINITY_DN6080_c0_g1_i1.p2 TRINITY_DN6080_c0_g1~~TRINITY_DN6080_c0_g1_i1.p2  ORF type:complete len:181 (+),score=44.87 TRINITY_DN6080_c0_g1_i1:315-857(+)
MPMTLYVRGSAAGNGHAVDVEEHTTAAELKVKVAGVIGLHVDDIDMTGVDEVVCEGDEVWVTVSKKGEAAAMLKEMGYDAKELNGNAMSTIFGSDLPNEQKAAIVQLMLQYNPNIHTASNTNRRTLLHMAVLSNCLPATQILLQHGADIAAPDKHNRTPMGYAIWAGNEEIINELCAFSK